MSTKLLTLELVAYEDTAQYTRGPDMQYCTSTTKTGRWPKACEDGAYAVSWGCRRFGSGGIARCQTPHGMPSSMPFKTLIWDWTNRIFSANMYAFKMVNRGTEVIDDAEGSVDRPDMTHRDGRYGVDYKMAALAWEAETESKYLESGAPTSLKIFIQDEMTKNATDVVRYFTNTTNAPIGNPLNGPDPTHEIYLRGVNLSAMNEHLFPLYCGSKTHVFSTYYKRRDQQALINEYVALVDLSGNVFVEVMRGQSPGNGDLIKLTMDSRWFLSDEKVTCVAYSPRLNYMASGHQYLYFGTNLGNFYRLSRLESSVAKFLSVLGTTSPIKNVVPMPDGSFLFSDAAGNVGIRKLEDTFPNPAQETNTVNIPFLDGSLTSFAGGAGVKFATVTRSRKYAIGYSDTNLLIWSLDGIVTRNQNLSVANKTICHIDTNYSGTLLLICFCSLDLSTGYQACLYKSSSTSGTQIEDFVQVSAMFNYWKEVPPMFSENGCKIIFAVYNPPFHWDVKRSSDLDEDIKRSSDLDEDIKRSSDLDEDVKRSSNLAESQNTYVMCTKYNIEKILKDRTATGLLTISTATSSLPYDPSSSTIFSEFADNIAIQNSKAVVMSATGFNYYVFGSNSVFRKAIYTLGNVRDESITPTTYSLSPILKVVSSSTWPTRMWYPTRSDTDKTVIGTPIMYDREIAENRTNKICQNWAGLSSTNTTVELKLKDMCARTGLLFSKMCTRRCMNTVTARTSSDCAPKYRDECPILYGDMERYDSITDHERAVCGCFRGESYNDTYFLALKNYIDRKGGTGFGMVNLPHCIQPDCASSLYYAEETRSQCPNITNCINAVEISNSGTIGTVLISSRNECGTYASGLGLGTITDPDIDSGGESGTGTGTGNGTGTGTGTGTRTGTGTGTGTWWSEQSDNTKLGIYAGAGVAGLLLVIGMYFLLKRRKPNSNQQNDQYSQSPFPVNGYFQ